MRVILLLMCAVLTACANLPFMDAGDGPDEAVIMSKPAELRVAWVRDIDQRKPLGASGYSLPTVTSDAIVIGGGDRRVHIYKKHGGEQGRIGLSAPSESGALTLTNDLVVLADNDGVLYGIDAKKIAIIWKQQLSSVLLGKPVAAGDDFLVQTADNRIYRFSQDGKKKWSYSEQMQGLTLHAGSSPSSKGDQVYAVFGNGDVVALKAESGDLLWRRQLYLSMEAAALSDIRAPVSRPVVSGDLLILSFFQGNITALSRKDGQQVWSKDISLKDTPLALGSNLYMASGDGKVFALDAASGQIVWKQGVSDAELIGPVAWKGGLVVGDSKGRITVLDMKGNIIKQLSISGRIDRSFVVFPGGILVRNDLGNLYLLH
ncbi:MAG: PQQ-binding-like beta-propeller repeat protein [Mariprofundaceae bacterium]